MSDENTNIANQFFAAVDAKSPDAPGLKGLLTEIQAQLDLVNEELLTRLGGLSRIFFQIEAYSDLGEYGIKFISEQHGNRISTENVGTIGAASNPSALKHFTFKGPGKDDEVMRCGQSQILRDLPKLMVNAISEVKLLEAIYSAENKNIVAPPPSAPTDP